MEILMTDPLVSVLVGTQRVLGGNHSCIFFRQTIWPGLKMYGGHSQFNPFTPKSDQLQFSLSVSHQRYIIQYGEFGKR